MKFYQLDISYIACFVKQPYTSRGSEDRRNHDRNLLDLMKGKTPFWFWALFLFIVVYLWYKNFRLLIKWLRFL